MLYEEALAAFITHLVRAGMSIEKAMEYGFTFAMECTDFKNGYPVGKREQLQDAAELLERASKKAGTHILQQRFP